MDAGAASCEGVPTDPEVVGTREVLALAEHRPQPIGCERTRPCHHVNAGVPGAIVCRSHAECTAGANGRCQPYGYACTYDACFTDDDCAANQLCDCTGGSDGAHVCVDAHCRSDADCPDGLWCSPSRPVTCYNLSRLSSYRCHTAEDECLTDRDCPAACVFDPARGHWRCVAGEAQCETP